MFKVLCYFIFLLKMNYAKKKLVPLIVLKFIFSYANVDFSQLFANCNGNQNYSQPCIESDIFKVN